MVQNIVDKPFAVITYTEAVDRLLKAKKKFEYPVNWGSDLQSEHERYLTEQEFAGTPLFVTDYPKGIKASVSCSSVNPAMPLPSANIREFLIGVFDGGHSFIFSRENFLLTGEDTRDHHRTNAESVVQYPARRTSVS